MGFKVYLFFLCAFLCSRGLGAELVYYKNRVSSTTSDTASSSLKSDDPLEGWAPSFRKKKNRLSVFFRSSRSQINHLTDEEKKKEKIVK